LSNWQLIWLAGLLILVIHLIFASQLDISTVQVRERQYGDFEAYFESTELYKETGVLFALKSDESGTTRGAFQRFEDHFYEDLGYLLLQAAALNFGLEPSLQTNLLINRFTYLTGIVVFAFTAGTIISRSAVGLLCIGLALLYSHPSFADYLYYLADRHGAAVALGLICLSLLCVLPIIVRTWSLGAAFWWTVGSGAMAGLVALIRQNVGLSLMAAALPVIFLFSLRRGLRLTVALLLAFLLGQALIGLSIRSLLEYRDAALHIESPRISTSGHGIWFPLLGGTGALCENSIGMEWRDEVIMRAILQENPSVLPKDIDSVARTIYLRYVRDYPSEFLTCVLYKASVFIRVVGGEAHDRWGPGLLVFVLATGVAVPVELSWGRAHRAGRGGPSANRLRGAVIACLLFVGTTAVVPILTEPAGFARETVVALFGTVLLALFASGFGLTRELVERARGVALAPSRLRR
jgi:hypothetical protein